MNQLRTHQKATIFIRIRRVLNRLKTSKMGRDIFFERNVKLMRFPKNITLGSDIVIKEGSRICSCNSGAAVSIGDNTTIGYHTFIFCSDSITIGRNCMIAPFVYIVDSDHGTQLGVNMNEQPNVSAPITIGNDVWIGTGAKILKGVQIDDGAIIAAGALVKSNVLSNEIFGGIPAKKIGERR